MQPDAVKAGGALHGRPRLLEVRARRALLGAGDDVRIAFDAWKRRQNGLRGGGKVDWLLAPPAVREENHAALHIDLRPLRVENFPQAGAGEDQEPDRGDGERIEFDAALIGLCQMLGAQPIFVNSPR